MQAALYETPKSRDTASALLPNLVQEDGDSRQIHLEGQLVARRQGPAGDPEVRPTGAVARSAIRLPAVVGVNTTTLRGDGSP